MTVDHVEAAATQPQADYQATWRDQRRQLL